MSEKISITDAELDIMNVLWETEPCTSQQILRGVSGNEIRNRNTVKTLLLRLVQKGAVRYEEINSRTYNYYPTLTRREFIASERKGFITKLFGGSAQKMLLNFVQEEQLTKEELTRLISLIEDNSDDNT